MDPLRKSRPSCTLLVGQRELTMPTSLIVLPYELKYDTDTELLTVPTESHCAAATRLGKCLLEVNKTTARLSFWLQVKRNLNTDKSFKKALQNWMQRARDEPPRDVASEMIKGLSMDESYIGICQEMLSEEEKVSHAMAYVTDPMRAGCEEAYRNTRNLFKCYDGKVCHFYLVDEAKGVPMSCHDRKAHKALYPLETVMTFDMLQKVFLPFMNTTIMSAMVDEGINGLAKLVGLPEPSYGAPFIWRNASIGIPQKHCQASCMRALVSLQGEMRATESGRLPCEDSDTSPKKSCEATGLKAFYKKNDPDKNYSNLRKKADEEGFPPLWTTKKEKTMMQKTVKHLVKKPVKQVKKQATKKAKSCSALSKQSAETEDTTICTASTGGDPFIGTEIRFLG